MSNVIKRVKAEGCFPTEKTVIGLRGRSVGAILKQTLLHEEKLIGAEAGRSGPNIIVIAIASTVHTVIIGNTVPRRSGIVGPNIMISNTVRAATYGHAGALTIARIEIEMAVVQANILAGCKGKQSIVLCCAAFVDGYASDSNESIATQADEPVVVSRVAILDNRVIGASEIILCRIATAAAGRGSLDRQARH